MVRLMKPLGINLNRMKFHRLVHLVDEICYWGRPKNTNTFLYETFHKEAAKTPYQRSNKVKSTHLHQQLHWTEKKMMMKILSSHHDKNEIEIENPDHQGQDDEEEEDESGEEERFEEGKNPTQMMGKPRTMLKLEEFLKFQQEKLQFSTQFCSSMNDLCVHKHWDLKNLHIATYKSMNEGGVSFVDNPKKKTKNHYG